VAKNPSEQFAELRGKPPAEARFFWNGGPVEVADRTWFSSLLSGVTAFETDDGLVLVDSGTVFLAPQLAKDIRSVTEAPVHTAIYTHGHVDHAYGLESFLSEGQAPPRVIGHRSMLDRFSRYAATDAHNQAVNARQFGGSVDARTTSFQPPPIPPDTLYDDALTIEVGGVGFELRHCRGETDDHTWVWCPSRGVLCPGDLIIWGIPNAGNPQKVQRYPWDWAAGLREMADLGARTLTPGHGGPVVEDAPLVFRILTETADLLEQIVERTLAALDAGSPPHVDIVRSVEIPRSDSPWLQPVYDEGEFIVRNVIRYYGGWWSGRPSELKPAPRDALAREVAGLAGGPSALAGRALAAAEAGDLALACHLADWALEAAPGDPVVQQAVAGLYEQRAEAEESLMAVNLYRSAAAYARDGRPFA
jgi:glyoxylase-like metal-dependent hydrolase (beta-lactamase superfamily II)